MNNNINNISSYQNNTLLENNRQTNEFQKFQQYGNHHHYDNSINDANFRMNDTNEYEEFHCKHPLFDLEQKHKQKRNQLSYQYQQQQPQQQMSSDLCYTSYSESSWLQTKSSDTFVCSYLQPPDQQQVTTTWFDDHENSLVHNHNHNNSHIEVDDNEDETQSVTKTLSNNNYSYYFN